VDVNFRRFAQDKSLHRFNFILRPYLSSTEEATELVLVVLNEVKVDECEECWYSNDVQNGNSDHVGIVGSFYREHRIKYEKIDHDSEDGEALCQVQCWERR